jgi:starch-binding outer membrane protein, SusD/RagB family
MKRTINKFLTVSLLALFVLGSCKKGFLERTPTDALPDDEALSTEDALEGALNGAYSAMRAVGLYGRDIPVIGDLHADNTFVETKNSGRYLQWYDYSVSSNDGSATAMWGNAYVAIQRANRIIEADVTGGRVDEIKAEARAIRALNYFNLVRTYGKPYSEDPNAPGVPLVLTYDPYYLPETRNTVGEVYAQIISDLTAAYAAGPEFSISGKLSKYAIGGLLAKVYLNKGEYANALTAAEDVINNSEFTLVTPAAFEGYWENPAPRTDAVETMFEIDADVISNNGFDDLGAMYINGYTDIYASRQLYDLYAITDVRKQLMFDGTTKNGASAVQVLKYPNANNDDRDNLKVLRLAEVYLVAAEAAFRTSDETKARQYLNDLMAQRQPGKVYASTGDQLLTDIITERRKELAFEGDRLFDLNRLKMPIVRIANAGAILAGPGNVNLTIPYPDNERIAPIPQAELQANPGLADEQNAGY